MRTPQVYRPPGAYVGEQVLRRVGFVAEAAPAFDTAVGAQPAEVSFAAGDRGEFSAGRAWLPFGVVAPAVDCVVGADRAGVSVGHGDGSESFRRLGCVDGITVPAADRVVGPHSADGAGAHGDGTESFRRLEWRRGPAAPAADRAGLLQAARECSKNGNSGEAAIRRFQLAPIVVAGHWDGGRDERVGHALEASVCRDNGSGCIRLLRRRRQGR